jgi:hypothetical protein
MDWISLVQDEDQCQTLVNMVIYIFEFHISE